MEKVNNKRMSLKDLLASLNNRNLLNKDIKTTFRSSLPEASLKKVFLNISQNLRENIRVSFLRRLQAKGMQLY